MIFKHKFKKIHAGNVKILKLSLSTYDSELISIAILIAWQKLEYGALFAFLNYPNGILLLKCPIFTSKIWF